MVDPTRLAVSAYVLIVCVTVAVWTAASLGFLPVVLGEWYSDGSQGGDTVSTEAVAARRHAGRHLPAIGWNKTTGNSQLALAA